MVFGRWIFFVVGEKKGLNLDICSHIFCEMMIRNSLLVREDLDIPQGQVVCSRSMLTFGAEVLKKTWAILRLSLLIWLHDGSSPSLANQ